MRCIRMRLITFVVAFASFAAVASAAIVPPSPPAGSGVVVPSWWNDQTTPFWSYHHEDIAGGGSVTEESNNGEFEVHIYREFGSSLINVAMRNGYSADLFKRFFFYFEGTTSASSDPTFVSLVADNDGSIPDSVIVPTPGFQAGTNTLSGTWYAAFTAKALPQPDWIYYHFRVPSNFSQITEWWVGEECLPPPPEIPEPAALGALGMGAALLLRRKRS